MFTSFSINSMVKFHQNLENTNKNQKKKNQKHKKVSKNIQRWQQRKTILKQTKNLTSYLEYK